MRVFPRSAIAGLLVVGALATAQAQRTPPGTVAGDRVLSPTVVASWIAEQEASGTAQLRLLVLWRGRPGWFLGGGPSGGGGSGLGRGVMTRRLHFGGVDLEFMFDQRTRVIELLGQRIDLGEANVVLVDTVDDHPRFVGARRVDPANVQRTAHRVGPAPLG